MRVQFLSFLILLCGALDAASDGIDQDDVLRLRQAGAIVPLEQLIGQARLQHPGDVLEAELETHGGGYRYKIEIMDAKGRVWEMHYDAGSGRPLGSKPED